MEVRFESNARHAHRVFDALFVVHREFLGDDMKDFLTGLHHQFVHVLDQRFDVSLPDFRFEVLPGDESTMLQALDVLTCDAHVHQSDLGADFLLGFLHRLFDGCHGAVDVGDNAARNPNGFTSAVTEEFDFAELVLLADETGNFGRTDVEADNNFCGGVLGLVVHHG